MFSRLGKALGVSKGDGSPTATAASQPMTVAPPNEENPVPVPVLSPFPLTGEQHDYHGYRYTVPSDSDFLIFRTLIDDVTDGWTLRYERDGVYAWDKTLPGEPMRLIKAFGVFENVSPERCYDLLQDPTYRIEWDQNRLDGFCFTHLTQRTDIGYYAAKVSRPVTNRDFVNMRSWREIGGGEYIIMSTSVPIADMPPKQGIVRAVVKVSGYLVRPFGKNSCSVSYVSHSDPKGWVPSYFVNSLTTRVAPSVIANMRKACVEYPAWIARRGEAYKREWVVPETPWASPQPNALHDWVERRQALGAAASPVVAEPAADDEIEEAPASPDTA